MVIKKPTRRQLKHWDKILIDSGLGEGVGRDFNADLIGHTNEIDLAVNKYIARKKGPKRPRGKGPE